MTLLAGMITFFVVLFFLFVCFRFFFFTNHVNVLLKNHIVVLHSIHCIVLFTMSLCDSFILLTVSQTSTFSLFFSCAYDYFRYWIVIFSLERLFVYMNGVNVASLYPARGIFSRIYYQLENDVQLFNDDAPESSARGRIG